MKMIESIDLGSGHDIELISWYIYRILYMHMTVDSIGTSGSANMGTRSSDLLQGRCLPSII